jgi:hypothetical protein
MLARVAAVVGATAAALSFAVSPASADPSSASVSPEAAAVGDTVDVHGSGLSGITSVTFSGAQPVAVTASDTDIPVVVPADAQSGPVSLSDGTNTWQAGSFALETLTLGASATSVDYPAMVTLTATLTAGGSPAPSQSVVLHLQPAGRTASTMQATTDSNGRAVFTVRPKADTTYFADLAATSSYGAATSNQVTVNEHPQVTFNLPTVAPILTHVHVTGRVWTPQPGKARLQWHTRGAWHTVQAVPLSAAGRFVFTLRLPSKSTFTYRVLRTGDSLQAGNVSATKNVLGVNRTLRSGLSGPDVTALQRRLASLHYDLGAITGTYNFDTGHAVTAFEKVNRLPRDGVVGPAVWRALASPRAPHLRHPLRGAAIEVDLAHQVVLYAVNGRIRRIFDSSTGGGYYYTGSDGTTQRAITPTGHFSVRYKVDHWVTSKLGVLWRPAYFNNAGYAIHGEPEVPAYPASHGCVRITVPAMNRLYAKLYPGLSVWIY